MTDDRLDACLRLVADRRRRGVIQKLRSEATGESTIDDLTDRLHSSALVSGNDGRPERDELAIELAHVHLPKLADHDVIDYDRRDRTVRYQPDERIEAVLDSLPEGVAPANP